MPNVVDIRTEVAEIKKMVSEIYERWVVAKPIIETVIPMFHVSNIWDDPMATQVEETK